MQRIPMCPPRLVGDGHERKVEAYSHDTLIANPKKRRLTYQLARPRKRGGPCDGTWLAWGRMLQRSAWLSMESSKESCASRGRSSGALAIKPTTSLSHSSPPMTSASGTRPSTRRRSTLCVVPPRTQNPNSRGLLRHGPARSERGSRSHFELPSIWQANPFPRSAELLARAVLLTEDPRNLASARDLNPLVLFSHI